MLSKLWLNRARVSRLNAVVSGGAWLAGKIFPSTYFQAISVGTFTKALGLAVLWPAVVALAVIAIVYFVLSATLLKKQEA